MSCAYHSFIVFGSFSYQIKINQWRKCLFNSMCFILVLNYIDLNYQQGDFNKLATNSIFGYCFFHFRATISDFKIVI